MSNQDAIEKLESKLASGELAPDYHVRQAIVMRYAENHGGLQLVGGVLVAVVGFSLVGWMGGVGIGLIAAQHLMNWHKRRSEDWRAIDSGRYGHLLTAAEAKQYERIYGKGSLEAAKQGDYSHAGLESEDAIDVPAEAVEDAKKPNATVEPTPDTVVASDEAAPVDATPADASVGNDEPAADNRDSRTPTPIALTDDRFSWAKDLLHFPAVLIWGPQGSGKTSFAAWLLHQRIAAGHSAWVCDPHKEFGQWNGLKCVGAGMDYEACDRAMIQFANTVKREYKTRSEQANYTPKRETVLVEEFTNWSDRCENAGEFFKASLSDLRKIKKGVIFVSHDRSLIALGNAKGFSKARNNGLLELFLEAKINPATGDPVPALKGKLKYPGKPAIDVEISIEMCGLMDFTQAVRPSSNSVQPIEPSGSQTVQPGSVEPPPNSESDSVRWLNRCLEVISEEPNQTGSRFGSEGEPSELEENPVFTAEKLTANQTRDRIGELKAAGLNQTQIIFVLWKAKKGGGRTYTDAVAEYKLLTGEGSDAD